VAVVPENENNGQPASIPVDYVYAAHEVEPGTRVLLDDGLLELQAESVCRNALLTRVLRGGVLHSRKGVNFPSLNLCLPSLTVKDEQDLDFGLAQGVDVISLSFVRCGQDVRILRDRIRSRGFQNPVIAKIEKPQGLAHLDEILLEAQGVMVARGDLGVEMSPEEVPMAQKRIIEQCNRRGLPVITATQMLESMIREPRPTRAEASDVANAIIDGTDAVMLSGESAVGEHPVLAVEMMARIAAEVESKAEFKSYPPAGQNDSHALSKAVKAFTQAVPAHCVVVFTTRGFSALSVAAERLNVPVIVVTTETQMYHALNLVWGIKPLLVPFIPASVEELVNLATYTLQTRGLAAVGDKVLVLAEIPANQPQGANFIKVHTIR